jgi:hypothetical protein
LEGSNFHSFCDCFLNGPLGANEIVVSTKGKKQGVSSGTSSANLIVSTGGQDARAPSRTSLFFPKTLYSIFQLNEQYFYI